MSSFLERLAAIKASKLSLKDKLATLRTEYESKWAQPYELEAIHRSIDELIRSDAAARALKAGDLAPGFGLIDNEGNLVCSRQLLVRGPLIVVFYRGVWCPYCNLDLQALEDARSEIEWRGAHLIAISQQTEDFSRKAQQTNSLGFPILSDPGGKVSELFGIRWTVPEPLRESHRLANAELPQFNGDQTWTLPMPARFLVGRDGIIAYAEVNPDYTKRPEPSEMFPVLDALRHHVGT